MPIWCNEPHHFDALCLFFIANTRPYVICAWSCIFLFPVITKVNDGMSKLLAFQKSPLLEDPSPSKQLAEEGIGRL